jgi:hypothetical protein
VEEGNRLSVIAFQAIRNDPEKHEAEPPDVDDDEEDAQLKQALAASRARLFLLLACAVLADVQALFSGLTEEFYIPHSQVLSAACVSVHNNAPVVKETSP